MSAYSGWWNWSTTCGSGGPKRRANPRNWRALSLCPRKTSTWPAKNAFSISPKAVSESGWARSTPLASRAKSRPSLFSCIGAPRTRAPSSLRLRTGGLDDGLVGGVVLAHERGDLLGRAGDFRLHRLPPKLLLDLRQAHDLGDRREQALPQLRPRPRRRPDAPPAPQVQPRHARFLHPRHARDHRRSRARDQRERHERARADLRKHHGRRA